MKKIILDTNFLTIPFQFNLDIFEQIDELMKEKYELITTDGVVKELGQLTKSKGKVATAAKIGLELIEKKTVKIIKTNENVDESIIKLSDKNTIVATNDRLLRKKLKDKNTKTIYLRGKKRLEMG